MALVTRRNQIPAYLDQMNNHHPCITKECENEKVKVKVKVKRAIITRRTQILAYLDRKNNQPVGSFIQPCITIESARGTY